MSRQAAILIIPADLSRPLILRRKDWDGPLWQVHQRGNGPAKVLFDCAVATGGQLQDERQVSRD